MSRDEWRSQVTRCLRGLCELYRDYHAACGDDASSARAAAALGEAHRQAKLALLLYMVEHPVPEGTEEVVRRYA